MKLGDVVWAIAELDCSVAYGMLYADKASAERAAIANDYDPCSVFPVRLVPVEEKDKPAPAPLPTPEEEAQMACIHSLRRYIDKRVAEAIRTDRERRGVK